MNINDKNTVLIMYKFAFIIYEEHLFEYHDNYYMVYFVTYMHSVYHYTLSYIQLRVLICRHTKVDELK